MYLLFAFLIGGSIGKKMTQGYAKIVGLDPNLPYFRRIDSTRNYPYFYLWKQLIKSIFDKRKGFLYKYVPSVPITFLYG